MSGNDAARVLADAAGGVRQTVAAMNARAVQLGAYDTLVETPSGLDGWHQLSNACDLTLVLRAAVHIPRLLAYAESPTALLPAQKVGKRKRRSVPLFNESQIFYDNVPGAILAKTGFTDASQHTYACVTQRRAAHRRRDAARAAPSARSMRAAGQPAARMGVPGTEHQSGRGQVGAAPGVAAVGRGVRNGNVLSAIAVLGTAAAALVPGRRRRSPGRYGRKPDPHEASERVGAADPRCG